MATKNVQAKGNKASTRKTATARKNPLSGAISEAKGKATVKAKAGAGIAFAILTAAEEYANALRRQARAKGALWLAMLPLTGMTADEGEAILRNKDKTGVLDVLKAKAERDSADDADKSTYTSMKSYASAVRKGWAAGVKPEAGEGYAAFYERAQEAAAKDKPQGKRNARQPGRPQGETATQRDLAKGAVSKQALKLVVDVKGPMIKALDRIHKALEGLTGDMLERATADAVRAIEAVREAAGVPMISAADVGKRASVN